MYPCSLCDCRHVYKLSENPFILGLVMEANAISIPSIGLMPINLEPTWPVQPNTAQPPPHPPWPQVSILAFVGGYPLLFQFTVWPLTGKWRCGGRVLVGFFAYPPNYSRQALTLLAHPHPGPHPTSSFSAWLLELKVIQSEQLMKKTLLL